MKSSGITRRIDELGRIVVPKEMRYNLGIRDGEPLEIYVSDNAIVIKKFSQIENMRNTSQELCNIISDVCNIDVIITDREKVVGASSNVKHLNNSILCDEHKRLIDQRETYISNKKESMYDLNKYFTILPIITRSDSSGLVIVASNEKNDECIKYAKIIQNIIVNKLDIS